MLLRSAEDEVVHHDTEDAEAKLVVQPRVRNNIIDYLELASSFDEQREYQDRVDWVSVPTEVINQWQDSVGDHPKSYEWDTSVFTGEELEALTTFHQVWDRVAEALPDPLPPLAEVQKLEAWTDLKQAAEECLRVLAKRGKLQE